MVFYGLKVSFNPCFILLFIIIIYYYLLIPSSFFPVLTYVPDMAIEILKVRFTNVLFIFFAATAGSNPQIRERETSHDCLENTEFISMKKWYI